MTSDLLFEAELVLVAVAPGVVAWCEGCGRPLYPPYVDRPDARCHWCLPGFIAWRKPAEEWRPD